MDQIFFGKVLVKEQVFPIAGPYCLFGSADGCDIRIKGAVPTHCQLEFNRENEAFLRCFRPVTLNGKCVSAITHLSDSASIVIENKEFTFVKQVQRTNKRIKPEEEARRFIVGQNDPDDLYAKHIDIFIGRGVFAKKPIRSGKFLAEYSGTLSKAARVQDKDTNYTHFFKHGGVDYCIDATKEPESYHPSLGRLVNHADNKKQRNSKMQIVVVDKFPILHFLLPNLLPGSFRLPKLTSDIDILV